MNDPADRRKKVSPNLSNPAAPFVVWLQGPYRTRIPPPEGEPHARHRVRESHRRIDIRPVYAIEDFGEALTPEAAAVHNRVAEKLGPVNYPARHD